MYMKHLVDGVLNGIKSVIRKCTPRRIELRNQRPLLYLTRCVNGSWTMNGKPMEHPVKELCKYVEGAENIEYFLTTKIKILRSGNIGVQ